MEKTKWMLILVALLVVPLRGQTPQKISDINKKVVGKWWSSDRKSYIEFLPNGVCSEGAFYGGTWHIEQGKLWAWERGKDFICLSGALTLIAPNTLIRDHGMGGALTKYYRALQQPKPMPGPAACTFCGVWEYVDNGSHQYQGGGTHYLKIYQSGGSKFKLVVGFDLAGKIEWREQQPVKNADSIYLRMVGGRLIGRFVSGSFYATHGHDLPYRITCSLISNNKMRYSIWFSGETETFVATRISD